jgi:hypothetical protein
MTGRDDFTSGCTQSPSVLVLHGMLALKNFFEVKLFLVPLLIIFTSLSCSGAEETIKPDLKGEKAITVYFLLGFLDEYLGRNIVEGSDRVERFYCNEHDKAELFLKYLRKLTNEQDIKRQIRKETLQKCLISYHSRDVSRFINSFYWFELSDRRRALGDDGEYKRTARAYTSVQVFGQSCRRCKLAYLAGAYSRYGVGNSFRFANSYRKAALVSDLLVEFGCTKVHIESTQGLAPQINQVFFEPSPEIEEWFTRQW